MTRVNKTAILFLIFAVFTANSFSPLIALSSGAKLKTYIVYDSPVRFGGNFPIVTSLIEYLGHFDLACQALPLETWQPGALQDAELVVYVGLKDTILPQKLLQEMANAKRVIWFERNIEQLAAYLQWQDFRLEGVSSGWSYVNYRRDLFFPEWMNVVIAQPGDNARIFATVKNMAGSKPLAWQRDNVYFCGLLEVDPVFMVTLGNLLHQFIPNNHQNFHRTLLRVEDVSPLTDPKAVSAVINTITKYHIPFAIGVIPVGIAGNDKRVYMHETPEMVRILQEAQNNGASIIMHGYTHQNEYSPKTGEGYEFWNARDDKPMENDESFTSERIEAGIAELVRCGLIPVAFEPPHYAMSKTGYTVLSRYFNVFSGQVQISDKSEQISLTMPYMATSAYLNGMIVVPENMGYYDGHNFLVEDMLRNSAQIIDEQDGFAGFFYHGYLPPDKLPAIIEGLRKQGYEFFDLRQLPIKVRSPKINITGQNGQIQVEIDKDLQDSWGNAPVATNMIERIGIVHLLVLLIIISLLAFIIIRLRANANKHYEG